MMVTQHPTPLPRATARRVVGDSSRDDVGGTRRQDDVMGEKKKRVDGNDVEDL